MQRESRVLSLLPTWRTNGLGLTCEPIESLVHWAHVIDGALYESPAQCVELKEPALQLMQVIEADPDDSFIEQIIRDLTTQSLEDGGDRR